MRFTSLILVALLLGCSSAPKQATLEGEREQLIENFTTFKADPALQKVVLAVPPVVNTTHWPQTAGNAAHNTPHFAVPEKLTQAWSYGDLPSIGKQQALVNAPIIADGRLFFVTAKSHVIALDAWNGSLLWSKKLYKEKKRQGLEIAGGAAFEKGVLYVTTSSGDVFALDAVAGDVLWQQNIGASVRAAPTVADGRVFVVSHDNRLQAFAAEDGQLLWAHSGIEETLAILGAAAPAVADGVVVVAYSSGEVYALSVANGRYLWHEALSAPAAYDPFANITAITASPVIEGGSVYVANTSGQMLALDLRHGRTLWRRDFSARSTPVVTENGLFILTNNNQLLGLHRGTGRIKWVTSLGKDGADVGANNVAWYGPILAGGRLIVVSTRGEAASYQFADGQHISSVELNGGVSVNPVVAGGILYFVTNNGEIVAFD